MLAGSPVVFPECPVNIFETARCHSGRNHQKYVSWWGPMVEADVGYPAWITNGPVSSLTQPTPAGQCSLTSKTCAGAKKCANCFRFRCTRYRPLSHQAQDAGSRRNTLESRPRYLFRELRATSKQRSSAKPASILEAARTHTAREVLC